MSIAVVAVVVVVAVAERSLAHLHWSQSWDILPSFLVTGRRAGSYTFFQNITASVPLSSMQILSESLNSVKYLLYSPCRK